MINNKLSISTFTDLGFDRLVELSRSTYDGREIANQEYLGWEYIKNPDGLALINVAESDSKIVSQYIVIPHQYSISNKIISGSLSVNTLTHPQFKGQGLFPKIVARTFGQCETKNISFTIGFPNNNFLSVIKRKQLFDIIGYLPLMVYPVNPLKSFLKYFIGKREKTGEEISLDFHPSNFSFKGDISFFDFAEDAGSYESFIQKFNMTKPNVLHRSPAFLRWRYVSIPLRKYHIIKIKSGDEIKAVGVFRARYMFGLRSLILVDLISSEDNTYIIQLLNLAKAIAKANKIDFMMTTAPAHTTVYKVVRKSGYLFIPDIFLPQKIALIVKRHDEACPPQINEFSKWFLTFGDYDIF